MLENDYKLDIYTLDQISYVFLLLRSILEIVVAHRQPFFTMSNPRLLFIDPKWIQEGLKIKVIGIKRNQCHCIYLVTLIPVIYIFFQMVVVCERYHILTHFPNRQLVKVNMTYCWHQHDVLLMSTWRTADINSTIGGISMTSLWCGITRRWHVSLKFGVFRLSWHIYGFDMWHYTDDTW